MPRYDYTTAGAYFVTFCTYQRVEWLSHIQDGESHLTPEGRAVAVAWATIPDRFADVLPDAFVIMPNHVHAVVHLTGGTTKLGNVIRVLKGVSTAAIRGFRPEFAWQRDYHDRVVRSDYELERIRNYIVSNPAMWDRDPDNLNAPEANRDQRDVWDVRNELRGHTR
jgi:REP element-mobilizing transposase RayT